MPSPHRSEDLSIHEFGRTDADAPTLVLLHGLTDSGRCWPDAVRRWRDDYRVLAWDARGHGESERFTEEALAYGIGETHLDDLVDLLESLGEEGIERPVLVGHSMGGGTAAAVPAHRPDLVRAVLLEDPALGNGRYDELDIEEGARRRVAEARATVANPQATMREGRTIHPDWPASEFQPWLDAKLQTDVDMLADPMMTVRTPWYDVAAAVAVPALIVTGDNGAIWRDDLLARLREVMLANDRLELEIVSGAGHCVRRDRTEAFHTLVDPWIAKQFAE
ncbi:MAG: alpha/beta hydrolase [Lapillicoccus sp.]